LSGEIESRGICIFCKSIQEIIMECKKMLGVLLIVAKNFMANYFQMRFRPYLSFYFIPNEMRNLFKEKPFCRQQAEGFFYW